MEIVEGTDAMRSGSNPLGGAMQVIQAIEAYGRHFDHPDWGKSQALGGRAGPCRASHAVDLLKQDPPSTCSGAQ